MKQARFSWFPLGFWLTLVLIIALPASSATKLTLWAWANQEVIDQFDAIARWFRESNPDVEIEIAHITGSQMDYLEKFLLASAGGAVPDVAWIEGGQVKHLSALGLLVDVTQALDGLEFTPGETEEVTFAGRLYAAPYQCTSRALFKRIDLFEQAGLDPYRDDISLDELWELNHRLSVVSADGRYTRVGIIPWTGNWGARGWIWGFGGELIEEVGNTFRPTATLPRDMQAFEWLDLWGQHYQRNRAPVSTRRTGFSQGLTAMYLGSTSDAAVIIREGTDFTSGPVPHPDDVPKASWGGGYTIGIPTPPSGQVKPEAFQLVRFFGTSEVQTRRFRQFESLLPANWKALRTIAPSLPAPYAGLLAQLPYSRPRTPLSGEYNEQLTNALNDVVTGKVTARAALEAVQVYMEARFVEVFGR